MKILFELRIIVIHILITLSFNLFSQPYTRDFLSVDTTIVFSNINEFAQNGSRIQLNISSYDEYFDILPIENNLLKKSTLIINRLENS